MLSLREDVAILSVDVSEGLVNGLCPVKMEDVEPVSIVDSCELDNCVDGFGCGGVDAVLELDGELLEADDSFLVFDHSLIDMMRCAGYNGETGINRLEFMGFIWHCGFPLPSLALLRRGRCAHRGLAPPPASEE